MYTPQIGECTLVFSFLLGEYDNVRVYSGYCVGHNRIVFLDFIRGLNDERTKYRT